MNLCCRCIFPPDPRNRKLLRQLKQQQQQQRKAEAPTQVEKFGIRFLATGASSEGRASLAANTAANARSYVLTALRGNNKGKRVGIRHPCVRRVVEKRNGRR
eukprot:GHVU01055421.1.p1 GENE.GHVU01055421.1~~GHVU01055421.1.p1  ORF type:complete len:102 (+),score=13.29 GHVU01055421.1:87-392(+)